MKKLLLICLVPLVLTAAAFAADAPPAPAPEAKGAVSDEVKALRDKMDQLGIHEKDLEEKYTGAKGKGGSGVILKHIPTGVEVKATDGGDTQTNRFLARKSLVEKIEQQSGLAAPPVVEEAAPGYEYPKIAPEASLTVGYRSVRNRGPEWQSEAEYEYPKDGFTFGGELRALPLPQRIRLEFDFANKKDYFFDANYAYKDIFLFSWLNRTIYHNMPNYELVDLGTDARFSVNRMDVDERYSTTTGINSAYLRLKTPNFPFHLYVEGYYVTKDGTEQQRYLGGSGYYDNLARTSAKRDIDSTNENITVGFNTHANFLELDYAHTERKFDAKGTTVLNDNYTGAAGRPSGLYPHNLVPDTKGSADVLKLHTSYSGRIYGAATLGTSKTENEYSGAKSEYTLAAVDGMWLPIAELTFVVRYKHLELDADNTDTTYYDPANPAGGPAGGLSVRQALSSKSDTVTGVMRIRPVKDVTVHVDYAHSHIERDNAAAWYMASATNKDTASVTVRARPLKSLTIKGKYTYESVNSPAYNTDNDTTQRGDASISWVPAPQMYTYLGYVINYGTRDWTSFVINDQYYVVGDRSTLSNQALATVGFAIVKDLNLALNYARLYNKIDQTVVYNNSSPTVPYLSDSTSPYTETAHVAGVTIGYQPQRGLNLGGGAQYVRSKETLSPSLTEASQPVPISDFSNVETREIIYSAYGSYIFKGGSSLDVRYKYADFKNLLYNNPYSEIRDGVYQTLLATYTIKF